MRKLLLVVVLVVGLAAGPTMANADESDTMERLNQALDMVAQYAATDEALCMRSPKELENVLFAFIHKATGDEKTFSELKLQYLLKKMQHTTKWIQHPEKGSDEICDFVKTASQEIIDALS